MIRKRTQREEPKRNIKETFPFYFLPFLASFALRWRSLISRSAASRAAARTSDFSARFFWITSRDAPTIERLLVFTERFFLRAISVVWSCFIFHDGRFERVSDAFRVRAFLFSSAVVRRFHAETSETGGIAFVATRGETDFSRLARVGGDVSGASRRDGTDARARARVDSRADRRWETRRVTTCLARTPEPGPGGVTEKP